MTQETKDKLIAAGRGDLIETHEISISGYGGVNRAGNIVDRRKFPDAVPIAKNSMFGIPEPLPITL